VLEEEIASHVELAKAYMASKPYKMSAPKDDLFEIDDALAADIVATSTLPGVSLTPALVENNKQMFPEVVKVLEQAEPKALELLEAKDEKGEVPEVEDGMEVVLEPNRILLVLTLLPLFSYGTTSILSSTSETSLFSSPASTIGTSSSFGVSSITASNSTSGPATSIFWSTWDPERAYGFGTQPPFSSYALHLDWWPAWSAKSNW
nr:hypothetical protein [Tanacetum cinerariifolium]